MLKIITLLLVVFSFPALASKCKVYGISDSPQNLDCLFSHQESVHLTCQKGQYLINGAPVEVAFHMEVEEGSNPLVFQSKKVTLTVVEEKGSFKAEARYSHGVFLGTCQAL